ncbi:MAG: hypothetical protein HWN67_22860 [Candidatus Helarchaeota archaeon]|nr:hypothetical protein [Candidatus Helarchaeota archaeon]
MTSSIKISDEAKARLEEFIARLRIEKNVKITQQDLLTKIILEALNNEELVIDKILNEETSPENDPLWIAIHNPVTVEKPPSKEDLDKLEEELWQK